MIKQPTAGRQTIITDLDELIKDEMFKKASTPDEVSETLHDSKVLDFLSSLEENGKTLCGMENLATSGKLITVITFVDQKELKDYQEKKSEESLKLVKPVNLQV